MKMILLPGYKELFGEPTVSYGQLVERLTSETVISVCIMLNTELNYRMISDEENQKRLRNLFSERFSPAQLQNLNAAYSSFYRRTQGFYTNYVLAEGICLQ